MLLCFLIFLWVLFSVFPPLKNWQRMFLIYCLAFFNILHSCWRQYCLNLSQYWYQNIKSCCQVSWHSNLLRRTRDKGLSLPLIASLTMWSCQESGPASEGRTCLASSVMEVAVCWCWDPTDLFLDNVFQKHHLIKWDHSSFKFICLAQMFCLLYERKALPVDKMKDSIA